MYIYWLVCITDYNENDRRKYVDEVIIFELITEDKYIIL